MTPVNRCDGCAHYRPIRVLYDRGVEAGECRPAPGAVPAAALAGPAFFGLWVRAEWDCQWFRATGVRKPRGEGE